MFDFGPMFEISHLRSTHSSRCVHINGQHHERLKERRMQYEMMGDIPVRGNKLLVMLLIFILQHFGQRLVP